MIPLPFTCQHEQYSAGQEDDHGNVTSGWATPVPTPCVWWTPSSAEPNSSPTGGDRISVDAVLVVDSSVQVDHRDKFTVDGRVFEVEGLPKDYDHGPFGFAPGRRVVELKWVG